MDDFKAVKQTVKKLEEKQNNFGQEIADDLKAVKEDVKKLEEKQSIVQEEITGFKAVKEEVKRLDEKLGKLKEEITDLKAVKKMFIIFVPLVGILLGIVIWWILRAREEYSMVHLPPVRQAPAAICNTKDRKNCHTYFMENIHRLENMYPEQDSNLWVMLYSAASAHVSLDEKPTRPITLLIYSSSDEKHKKTQILEDIGNLYDTVLSSGDQNGKIIIDGADLENKNVDEVQKIIIRDFENGFQSGKKVAVVNNFHLLPSCSVLVFHHYCNNEDAPYTDVAIIFKMIGTTEIEQGQRVKELEKKVGAILHEKWRDCPDELPPGKITAMLSRVANNVILLR